MLSTSTASPTITDKLTTLYSRAMMDVVLSTEVQRAERFSFPMALMVFDVDQLSEINRRHGYGVGDRLLERLGILIRNFFRQNDWVFRHGEDSIAVLLCQVAPTMRSFSHRAWSRWWNNAWASRTTTPTNACA